MKVLITNPPRAQNPIFGLQTIHTNIGSFKTVEPEKKQDSNLKVEPKREVFATLNRQK